MNRFQHILGKTFESALPNVDFQDHTSRVIINELSLFRSLLKNKCLHWVNFEAFKSLVFLPGISLHHNIVVNVVSSESVKFRFYFTQRKLVNGLVK